MCFSCHFSITEWITAIATFLLFLVAWIQLSKLSKNQKTDFIRNYEEGFFGDENKKMIEALEDDELSAKIINENTDDEKFIFTIKGEDKEYKSNDFDNVIGYFETIGYLEKRGRVEIDMIYELFEYYIRIFWNFSTKIKYIEYSRTGDDGKNEDVYFFFEYIFYKLQLFRKAKLKTTVDKGKKIINWLWLWLLWWNVKFFVNYKLLGKNLVPKI